MLALVSAVLASLGAAPGPVPMPLTPTFTLHYAPLISTPTGFRHLNTSSNGAGKLFEIVLDPAHAYTRPTQLIELEGEPDAVGEAYGELIGRDFAALVGHGETRPSGWRRCASPASLPSRDGLPDDFAANELRLPANPVLPTHKRTECALWLGNGFYERIGLIN